MAKQTTAAAAPRPQWGCQSGAQGGRLAVAGARCALRLRRRRRASQRKGAGLHPCLVCCCCCCRLQAAGFRQAAKERERESRINGSSRPLLPALLCPAGTGTRGSCTRASQPVTCCQCREIPECAAAACTRAKSLKPRRQARSKAAPCRAFRRGGRPAVAAAVGVGE